MSNNRKEVCARYYRNNKADILRRQKIYTSKPEVAARNRVNRRRIIKNEPHKSKRAKVQQRLRERTQNAINSYVRWDHEEMALLFDLRLTDMEIAEKTGRSQGAVSTKRARLKDAHAPIGWEGKGFKIIN